MYHAHIEYSESKWSGLFIVWEQENIDKIMEKQDLFHFIRALEFL